MHSKMLLHTAILVSLLGLGGCAADSARQRADDASPRQSADVSPLNDSVLNDNVVYAIQGVPGVNPDDLQVSTRDGVVTLRGRTQTRMQAQDAIEAARHVPGVRKVDYDISVEEP